MKLYIWAGPDVLLNYGSGHAIAFAESIDNARKLLWQEVRGYSNWYDLSDPDDSADFNQKVAFLARKPDIYYTKEVAFAIHGSE